MAAYFVDSSALVKRYVQETGTDWVRGLTHRRAGNEILIARITAVEVVSAVARRRTGGLLTAQTASSILYRFRKHLIGRYLLTEMTPSVLSSAMDLANTHALRAYDAVQLAAAIEMNRRWSGPDQAAVTLVSADRQLNGAAVAEGLDVEDPNVHP